jgi:hypothetical protein
MRSGPRGDRGDRSTGDQRRWWHQHDTRGEDDHGRGHRQQQGEPYAQQPAAAGGSWGDSPAPQQQQKYGGSAAGQASRPAAGAGGRAGGGGGDGGKHWLYKDQMGDVRGPFSASQLLNWFKSGW